MRARPPVPPSDARSALDEQDRSRWDRDAIREARNCSRRRTRRGVPDPYQLQAAIAALHARAPGPQATDWPAIASLYALLAGMMPRRWSS